MSNRGWENESGAGEQVSSTARVTGDGTEVSAASPFLRGSQLASPGTALPETMGDRSDLFEVRGQMSADN